MGRYLCYLIKNIERQHPEIQVIEVNTNEDHVHILASIAPKLSVADAVKIVKANTARMMKKKFPFITQGYWHNDTMWSVGYFVSTIGINEAVMRKYIEMQGKEDSGQAKLGFL